MKFIDLLQGPKVALMCPPYVGEAELRNVALRSGLGLAPIAVPFDITNVSRYFFEETPKEYWHLSDFPNLKLPFPVCWFEAPVPRFAISKEKGQVEFPYRQQGLERWGVMVREFEGELLFAPYYMYRDHRVMGPFPMRSVMINQRGSVVNQESGILLLSVPKRNAKQRDQELDLAADTEKYVVTTMLALQFINCRNVVTQEVEPAPKLSRKYERKTGRPLLKYREILIQNMGARSSHSSGEPGEGGRVSLHIRRGHFKHFGEEFGTKPLFGRWSGTFWWDAHAAGNADVGRVEHTYKVEP